jgi:CheY-like chemotaxis protein/HPt (histidine-containing phosphotransfer) domain-containing protein
MPEMDGLAFAREVRADPALCNTKLVMLTSASHLADADVLHAIGLEAFLVKPTRQAQLQQTLARVLSPGQSGPEPGGGGLRARTPIRVRSSLRVLVVEDNVVNQKVAQRYLAKLDHQVDIADNGARALEILALQRYDVILMDCQMPVLDGFETTRRIRAGQVPNLDPRVPIVALTAYAMEGSRQKCFAAGMDDYVSKPIRFEELKAALERASSRASHQAPPFAGAPMPSGPVVLDLAQLEHLKSLQDADDPHFLTELIDLFLAETPKRFRELLAALAAGDARAVAQLAHTVKGACANFGARALQSLCLQIEDLARLGSLQDVPVLAEKLEPELAHLAGALSLQKERLALEHSRR